MFAPPSFSILAVMTGEAGDIVLAAARELRLRRFMGPLPFDADEWTRKGLECDLPRPTDAHAGYHFEVRDVDYTVGMAFQLRLGDQGTAQLTVATSAHPHPADLAGWRVVVTELNRFAPKSVFAPRVYIWLHGNAELARAADTEHRARLDEAMRRTGLL